MYQWHFMHCSPSLAGDANSKFSHRKERDGVRKLTTANTILHSVMLYWSYLIDAVHLFLIWF
jgi:hypothetical protein